MIFVIAMYRRETAQTSTGRATPEFDGKNPDGKIPDGTNHDGRACARPSRS